MADATHITGATNDSITTEKTFANGNNHADALQQVRTAGSINIPPELFEKLYLTPQNPVKGELRNTFGNPTPLYVLILPIGHPVQQEWMGHADHSANLDRKKRSEARTSLTPNVCG